MDVREFLTDDGQALLALCSNFALTDPSPTPLTLSQWNDLETQIHSSSLSRPSQLQGLSADRIAKALRCALIGVSGTTFQLIFRGARG